MKWSISLSRDANEFLARNKVDEEEIFDLVQKSLLKFRGENINVDIKKLRGAWLGFYRIRKGKLRIIIEFNFDNFYAFIEKIDWRDNVYKN